MRDLASAMGINPNSLYREFGSKQDLFADVLACYGDGVLAHAEAWLSPTADVTAAERLTGYLTDVGRRTLADPDQRGCLLVKTRLAVVDLTSEVAMALDRTEAQLQDLVVRTIEAGHSEGSIPSALPAAALAQLFLAARQRLALLAGASHGPRQISATSDAIRRLLTN